MKKNIFYLAFICINLYGFDDVGKQRDHQEWAKKLTYTYNPHFLDGHKKVSKKIARQQKNAAISVPARHTALSKTSKEDNSEHVIVDIEDAAASSEKPNRSKPLLVSQKAKASDEHNSIIGNLSPTFLKRFFSLLRY